LRRLDAQRPLAWIYPLEDAVSKPHWRHRRAPAGIRWSIPLEVIGGGTCHSFEILSGPPGLTIERVQSARADTPPHDYLTLPEPRVGTSTITLRVTDDHGAHATRSWSLEVLEADNTDCFLFFDDVAGADDNPGTPAAPKRDIGGLTWDDDDDASYADHQFFYNERLEPGSEATWSSSSGHARAAELDTTTRRR
jgi:hypothetical protein